MAIPDFQKLMLPVLRAAADGEVKISDVVSSIGKLLLLTDEELSELLPSGKQTTFANRVNWAKSYLGKAGLINLTRRGYFVISESGRAVLASPPTSINIKFLETFPGFKAFREVGDQPLSTNISSEPSLKDLTPDEIIRSAHSELDKSLSAELLTKVLSAPPDFFERLVVQLLVAMGYGGSAADAGRALKSTQSSASHTVGYGGSTADAGRTLGKSGDGGVDGVIDQDALGLDRIYVQAKRYADNKVSAGDIRDFFGSLDRFKASKGLFVTTSGFSLAAKETAELLSKRIVLIDGNTLTRLMIRYDIGCRIEETIHIKKLDEEFFD